MHRNLSSSSPPHKHLKKCKRGNNVIKSRKIEPLEMVHNRNKWSFVIMKLPFSTHPTLGKQTFETFDSSEHGNDSHDDENGGGSDCSRSSSGGGF